MLTNAEHKELLKLYARCIDPKDGETILKDADKKEVARLDELVKKLAPEPAQDVGEPRPTKIPHYVQSEQLKHLIEKGAQFVGAELRNHGSTQKPSMVIREWVYIGKGEDRKASFVQYAMGHAGDARVIEAGRTIAASALRRFQK